MSFWAGVASGFKDAKAAKAEKEELEARRAERQATFEYNRGRDKLLDQRYTDQQAEMLRRWEITTEEAKATRLGNEEWRQKQADQAQANLEQKWKRDDKYAEREWALTLDKFDFQKSSYEDGKAHADKVFKLTIDKFDYAKDQDVIANLRKDAAEVRQIAMDIYQKERDKVGDGIALENREFRLKQFENQVKQQGITNDQWNQTFDLKKEEIEIARTTQMLSMIPSTLSASMGGDGKGSAGSKGHAMSKEAMVQGSKLFKAEYSSLSDEAKESEFFKAAASSPATQATLMAFVEAQAKKGNTVKLDELPKYFKYAGSTEGQGAAKAKETIDSLMSGEMDLNDKDSFIKGLMNLKNYKPAEELFMQTSSPDDLKTKSEKIKYWETAIETDAYRKLDSFPQEDRRKIDKALTGLQRKERRTESLDVLASYGLGMDAVTENNMADIGVIKSYYGDQLSAPVEVEQPAEIVAPDTPAEVVADTREEFESFEAAKVAIENGFTGKYSVGGKAYKTAEPLTNEEEYTKAAFLQNDAGEELDIEDAIEADFGEDSKLADEGAISKYASQQSESFLRMGDRLNVSDEQAEGNRPGEREIDTEKFVDRSFQEKPTRKKPMDLTEANVEIVTEKVEDVVDSIPPRTPKGKRVEWAIKEFKKKYKNSSVHMGDDEIEARIEFLVNSVNQ